MLREQRGLSQLQLAVELDWSSGFIADIEQARRIVSLRKLIILANFFETTPNYLLGYSDKM